ncbi:diaminopropionate ammonia-lyase [Burkholderia sp. Ac-20379]|uniref:diaminopropionate ammonia-lyase n=1 Tax=Burkholderia sp. Ac-20379 TaxID=2703900 RepID=UPI00198192DD|nr:diaminopropionate ammonia-lyase [Burkholderia sp. Ac-20379]MBN3723900.1 diaminopropionate ammonia-lyase [Burkholderia sp. Ac-20379]
MLVVNARAERRAYPDALKALMSVERAEESRNWIANWRGVSRHATPLYDLPDLAARIGVAQVRVKDESVRSELGSFKALGAPIALVRLIMRLNADAQLDPAGLFRGAYRSRLDGFTVVSATDGNHGKGLAAAARSIGCRCVIVLHANVSVEREAAIAEQGAQIVRIAGNYDESVAEAARLAEANGWQVVSDTSYPGYEIIPRDVMQGYGAVAAEIVEATRGPGGAPAFSHVFLQGGVGGLAAGISSYFWEVFGEQRPTVVIVEPEQADCLFQSAISGVPEKATGSVDSIMAGLACGETSPLAWRFLVTGADYFMTIRDADAVVAMQILAAGSVSDIPIVSGESGAAGLAGLRALAADGALAKAGIGSASRILVINTEGATAPAVYAELVGERAEDVLRRQAAWVGGRAA